MRTSVSEGDLDAVEGLLGHRFADRTVLRQALTHSSVSVVNNEALATLGDALHKAWVARRAYWSIRPATKGAVTGVINQVCDGRKAQAPLLRDLGLDGFLVLGGALGGNGGVVTDDKAATAFEALVAAIDVDGGRDVAEAFLERVGGERVDIAVQEYQRR